jgi:ferredoxin-thioredoxin reductase catalytic subunit/DNA-directed RNA polymerase subunit RPC12/RpoP
MNGGERRRIFCPVCGARFPSPSGSSSDGDKVVCPVCGQRLVLREGIDAWQGERDDVLSDSEIADRIEEFARLRGYVFNEMKEEIVEGLLGKRDRFGDFFCPCRMLHTPDYQCPCRPTRTGDVEAQGRCHCGLFWKKTADAYDSDTAPMGQL